MPATIKLYHGSNQIFKQFEQSKSRVANDFYGGGVAYFTDDIDAAITYSKSMAKKGGDKTIYEVDLKISKIFDIDDYMPLEELHTIYGNDNKKYEDFARGAGLLKYGVDKYGIITKLQEDDLDVTKDQAFKGFSKGMTRTSEAREILKKLGYDSLRYNANRGASVYISYNANNIRIYKYYFVSSENKLIELVN